MDRIDDRDCCGEDRHAQAISGCQNTSALSTYMVAEMNYVFPLPAGLEAQGHRGTTN